MYLLITTFHHPQWSITIIQTPFIHNIFLYITLLFLSDSIGANNSKKPTYLPRGMEATHIREKGVVEGSENIAAGKENEQVLLKNIIATHPLYELLIQSHINCFKVRNFLHFLFFSTNNVQLSLSEKDTSHCKKFPF